MASLLKKLFFTRQVSLENRILSLADETKDFLLLKDLQNIRDYIENNEFGLAFEILCDQLFEYDALISSETYSKIELIGKDLGLNEKNWICLKK